jgi:ubiquinol-cytochrome c reductase cytochrome b subunit
MPGIVFTLMYAWPLIDQRIYRDYRRHNLLDRPRDKPFRTGVGVAAIIYFAVLTIACADDILSINFKIKFELILEILQIAVIVGPILGFAVAYGTCKALQRTNAHPILRPVGGVIFRAPDGAYHTVGEVHGDGHVDTDGHADQPATAGNGHAAETAPAPAGAGEPAAGD